MLKYFRLLLVAALLLTFGSVVLAQEPEFPVFCGDLSEADCDILTQAQAASIALESASFTMNADFTITNIPDAPFESLAFNLSGDGAYTSDPTMMTGLMDLQSNPAALLENPEQFAAVFEDLLNNFDGALNLTLTLPTELVDAMGGGGQDFPESLSIELRLVEGIGYINLDQISQAIPQAGLPEGWYGLELAALMGMMMEQSVAQMDGAAMQGFDTSTFSQFANPEFIGEYATIERLEDQDGAAVFLVTFDYAGFFSSEVFRDLMQQQMDATGASFDEAEFDEMMTQMGTMLEDVTLEYLTYIDLETSFVQRVETSFSFDTSAMMAEMGGDMAAPVFDFTASIDYSDFNDTAKIIAPDDVQAVLSAQEAFQLFGMGMMSGAAGSDTSPMMATPTATSDSATPEATPGS